MYELVKMTLDFYREELGEDRYDYLLEELDATVEEIEENKNSPFPDENWYSMGVDDIVKEEPLNSKLHLPVVFCELYEKLEVYKEAKYELYHVLEPGSEARHLAESDKISQLKEAVRSESEEIQKLVYWMGVHHENVRLVNQEFLRLQKEIKRGLA